MGPSVAAYPSPASVADEGRGRRLARLAWVREHREVARARPSRRPECDGAQAHHDREVHIALRDPRPVRSLHTRVRNDLPSPDNTSLTGRFLWQVSRSREWAHPSRESGLQLDGGRRLLLRGRWLDQCQGRGRRSCAKAGRRGRGRAHLGMRIGRCRRLPWMLPCLTTTSSTAVFFGTCLLLLLKAVVLCLLCLFA